MLKALWVSAIAAVWLGGCGASSTPKAALASEFTERDAALFDNGVDFIASALSLEGPWREEWHTDLRQRVAAADGVAVVSVRTVRTDTDPTGIVTHRLFVRREKEVDGDFPSQEVQLATRQGGAGFRTVDGRIERLQGERFVAFIKHKPGAEGAESLRWHLAPASEDVVAATARIAGSSEAPKQHVIVHEHRE